MSPRGQLGFSLYLSWKKVRAAKSNFVFLAIFLGFLGFLWGQAGFSYARRFYLILFPYLFLLLAQDIFREELDSGCLENVIFLRLNFRQYLWAKNFALGFLAAVMSAIIFLVFLGFSIIRSEAVGPAVNSYCRGLAVGFNYVALAGLLGLRLRSGSNVLALVLLQVFLFLGIFIGSTSLASGRDLVDLLISGGAASTRERLLLLAFVGFWPNAVISANYRHPLFLAEVFILIGLYLFLQAAFFRRLELKKQ